MPSAQHPWQITGAHFGVSLPQLLQLLPHGALSRSTQFNRGKRGKPLEECQTLSVKLCPGPPAVPGLHLPQLLYVTSDSETFKDFLEMNLVRAPNLHPACGLFSLHSVEERLWYACTLTPVRGQAHKSQRERFGNLTQLGHPR